MQQIAFPLGGLGAGCLHLGGAGSFQDFCLFNEPTFGRSPMTFAAVHCLERGRKRSALAQGCLRVLEGPVQNPRIYDQGRFGNGALASGHEGLPHMRSSEFRGEFPFAWVRLVDPTLPLSVRIEAYSPFVPRDDIASGLPAAFVTYRLRSRATRRLQVQFSFNVQFPAEPGDEPRVDHRNRGKVRGLYFANDLPEEDPKSATVAVVAAREGQKANCAWFRGGWFDALTMLTNQLSSGRLVHAPRSRTGGPRPRTRSLNLA